MRRHLGCSSTCQVRLGSRERQTQCWTHASCGGDMIRFLHHCSQLTSSSQIQSSVFLGGTASGQGGTPYVCISATARLRDCLQFPAREMLHKTPANEGPSGWDMSRFPSVSLSANMEQPCTQKSPSCSGSLPAGGLMALGTWKCGKDPD